MEIPGHSQISMTSRYVVSTQTATWQGMVLLASTCPLTDY
jgi:hypothetical protein